MLRLFGATIGPGVHIHPSVQIAIPWNLKVGELAAIGDGVRLYNLGPMSIGERSCISQGAHLCGGTHDYRKRALPLVKCAINIEADAWICADAFIGPGVTVSHLAVVGARAVVLKDVPARAIVGGNPAVFLKFRPTPS